MKTIIINIATALVLIGCCVTASAADAHPKGKPIGVHFEIETPYKEVCNEVGCGHTEVTVACPRGSRMMSSGFETYTRGDRITFTILDSRKFGNEKRMTFGDGEGTGWAQEVRLTAECFMWKAHL